MISNCFSYWLRLFYIVIAVFISELAMSSDTKECFELDLGGEFKFTFLQESTVDGFECYMEFQEILNRLKTNKSTRQSDEEEGIVFLQESTVDGVCSIDKNKGFKEVLDDVKEYSDPISKDPEESIETNLDSTFEPIEHRDTSTCESYTEPMSKASSIGIKSYAEMARTNAGAQSVNREIQKKEHEGRLVSTGYPVNSESSGITLLESKERKRSQVLVVGTIVEPASPKAMEVEKKGKLNKRKQKWSSFNPDKCDITSGLATDDDEMIVERKDSTLFRPQPVGGNDGSLWAQSQIEMTQMNDKKESK